MQHKQNIAAAKPDSLASVQLSYIANQTKHSSCDCLPSLDRGTAQPANHHLRALYEVVIWRNMCWWKKLQRHEVFSQKCFNTKCFFVMLEKKILNEMWRQLYGSSWRKMVSFQPQHNATQTTELVSKLKNIDACLKTWQPCLRTTVLHCWRNKNCAPAIVCQAWVAVRLCLRRTWFHRNKNMILLKQVNLSWKLRTMMPGSRPDNNRS